MSNVSIAGYAGWPTYDTFLIVSLSGQPVYDPNPLKSNLNPKKSMSGLCRVRGLGRTLTPLVRTYVIHLLGTYVTILYNWLILWQNTLYLYLGRSRMCLILQETLFQDQVLKPCKSVQDSSWKVSVIKARQLAIYRA